MKKKTAIVALEYLEPDYKQTLDCLDKCHHDIYFANRDGVGNMSRAFNDAFYKNVSGRYEYVWFITNVVFNPQLADYLTIVMNSGKFDAIHPACKSSDHLHLRPNGTKQTLEVPFIEFMAPMFKTDVFEHDPLDERLWYWYMDLDICCRMKRLGRKFGCAHAMQVQHTYLRQDDHNRNFYSMIRKEMRQALKAQGIATMEAKYGYDWQRVVGWKE